MEQWLTQRWYGNAPGAVLLQPLAWLYAAVFALRSWMYRAGWLRVIRIDRPVIVVGNLTVGGTGKTPLVVWIAQLLRSRGLRPAIVSRGYGGRGGPPETVTADADPKKWRHVGDEPVLLARRTGCPVIVAADRVAAAREAVAVGADVIISDDGLQHLRLGRDFEIAVIDGARGLGNGRLLPAGPLRESPDRLGRVDLVVINGSDDHPDLRAKISAARVRAPQTMHLVAGAVQPVSGRGAAQSLTDFRGAWVHAVAGIGNPQRFFRMLRELGIRTVNHAFPDHHPFVASDLAFPDRLPVLMTEKDAVRCAGLADERMWYVPVTAELEDAPGRSPLARLSLRANAPLKANR